MASVIKPLLDFAGGWNQPQEEHNEKFTVYRRADNPQYYE